MRIIVAENYEAMSRQAANILSSVITMKPDCVLGLATGSTPIGTYRELIKRYNDGDLDFSRVKSVNLDEYVGLEPTHDQSYRYFMQTQLFDHVNIHIENTNVPGGLAEDVEAECHRYDEIIASMGGIDIQVLGMGHNGHIGFNEPADHFPKGTHQVELAESTIEANARFFEKKSDVPTQALTMGMGSIMKSRAILLLASGKSKVEAIAALRGDEVTPRVPATFLKLHPNVTVICDKAAFGE